MSAVPLFVHAYARKSHNSFTASSGGGLCLLNGSRGYRPAVGAVWLGALQGIAPRDLFVTPESVNRYVYQSLRWRRSP